MKRIILLTIAAGSLAAGCTGTVVSEPAYGSTSYYRPSSVNTRWVTIADGYAADVNAQQIVLMGQLGPLRSLRVEAVAGAPVIKQVTVEYMDEDAQIARVDQRLRAGQGQVIPLDSRGRAIKRVIVYTEPRYGGRYSVFGT
jgi:hypothetical protein